MSKNITCKIESSRMCWQENTVMYQKENFTRFCFNHKYLSEKLSQKVEQIDILSIKELTKSVLQTYQCMYFEVLFLPALNYFGFNEKNLGFDYLWHALAL